CARDGGLRPPTCFDVW
nr:immunoglobulin heavy chain junction region [Mus musculus]